MDDDTPLEPQRMLDRLLGQQAAYVQVLELGADVARLARGRLASLEADIARARALVRARDTAEDGRR